MESKQSFVVLNPPASEQEVRTKLEMMQLYPVRRYEVKEMVSSVFVDRMEVCVFFFVRFLYGLLTPFVRFHIILNDISLSNVYLLGILGSCFYNWWANLAKCPH